MTANDSRHNRSAYAELARERSQALAGLTPLASSLAADSSSPTDLVSLLARELRVCAALLVHGLRDWLQVSWVHAGSLATQVVDLEARWDRAYEVLIEVAMRCNEALILGTPHAAVTLARERHRPDPAGRLVAAIFDLVSLVKRREGAPTSDLAAGVVAIHESLRLAFAMALRCRRVGARVLPASASAIHIRIFAALEDGVVPATEGGTT